MPFIHKLDTMGPSSAGHFNFFWKHEQRPIYHMDNHGAALPAWLNEVGRREPYSIVHIDYHRDDVPFLDKYRFEELPERPAPGDVMALRVEGGVRMSNGQYPPVIRWDNYLHAMRALRLRGQQFHGFVHQESTGNARLRFSKLKWRHSVEELFSFAAHELPTLPGRLLINLDLDYFFIPINERPRLAFSQVYIEKVVGALADAAPKNAVWTIAWSPECCGGWEEARQVAETVDYVLDTAFPFDELNIEAP